MNVKKYIIAGIVVFIIFQLSGFVIHNIMLQDTYQKLHNLWRPDMMAYMWIMYITSLIVSFIFTYLYIKMDKKGGLIQGLIFGTIVGLFMNVGIFNQFAIYPLPFYLVVQWFIYEMISYVICGAIISFVYKYK